MSGKQTIKLRETEVVNIEISEHHNWPGDAVDPEMTRKINETPALLSLLYDVNLMPEQINDDRAYKSMQAVVIAYGLGASSNG